MKERDKAHFEDRNRADILLVVNMFLTGFDAKKLNTLYVDKNLTYHGLIQAYSRTNRILGELKSQGNIVCFRNLKENTDAAIKLFCNTQANESILLEPYAFYVDQFNNGVNDLVAIAETPDAVSSLLSEDAQLAFVRAFRHLIRTHNKLKVFSEFSWADLQLDEQSFEDFKSHYLDIYDHSRQPNTGASIIEELDFELELIQRDTVSVSYILRLLADIQTETQTSGANAHTQQALQSVLDQLSHETQLRSKRALIETFIQDYMPNIGPEHNFTSQFVDFWHNQKNLAIQHLCDQERLDKAAAYHLMDEYNFTGKDPLRDQVLSALHYKPLLLERKAAYTRVVEGIKTIIRTYDDDTGLFDIDA